MAPKQTSSPLNKSAVYQFLKQNQLLERPLWVAVSGGLDSMVMLRLMLELREGYGIEFTVFHAHHGLSQYADDWLGFVERYCDINEVAQHSVRLELSSSKQASLEQVARNGRYQALSKLMPDDAVVLTGHHQADQAETFLLRLIRRSGLKGLGAMKSVAPLPSTSKSQNYQHIARPLLEYSQAQLAAYAKQHHLEWVTDESNDDTVFDRNFIRHEVLPRLESRWPHATNAITQTTKLLQQDQALLEEYLQTDLEAYTELIGFGQIENTSGEVRPLFELLGLNVNKLSKVSSLKQNALLKRFIEKFTQHAVGQKILSEVASSMVAAGPDRQPVIEINDVELRLHKGWLFALEKSKFKPDLNHFVNQFEVRSHTDGKILVSLGVTNDNSPYTSSEFLISPHCAATFDNVKNDNRSSAVKLGELSAKLRPNPTSGTKKVSEILKQNNCPAWLRHLVPVVMEVNEQGAVTSTHAFALLGFAVHTKKGS